MQRMWAAGAPLLLGFAFSAVLTPVVRFAAQRAGFYARPAHDRWHQRTVAEMGGVAIAVAFAFSLTVTAGARGLAPLLAGTGLMFVLGVVDDVRALGPATKLVGQMLAAALILYLAPPVQITGVTVVDGLLAFIWIVGISNALNLLDNMDGLAAGIAAIAALFYLAVLLPAASAPLVAAIGAFLGSMVGFLIYNFHPASIFMGDGGSLFLGSFLASVSVLVAPELQPEVATVAAVPVLILLVPIFDTAFVAFTRPLAGRSPLIGGRDHTSHRLVAFGVSERRAVLSLYGVAAIGGGVALAVRHTSAAYATLAIGLYIVALAFLGVVLGHAQVRRDHSRESDDAPSSPLVSEIAYQNRSYEVLLDLSLIACAYYAAFAIRFQGDEFAHFLPYFARSFPIVVGCQLAGLWLAGKYRQVWRSFGAHELLTILKGIVFGVAASVILVLYLYRFIGFSRGVFVIEGVVLSFLLVGARVAISTVDEYLRKRRTRGSRALIYGAGRGGVLLARELLQNGDLALAPVGFVDDDPEKYRLKVEGLPVLGSAVDLPAILARAPVAEVIISIRDLPPEPLELLVEICRRHGVRLRRMRLSLDDVAVQPVKVRTGIPHGV